MWCQNQIFFPVPWPFSVLLFFLQWLCLPSISATHFYGYNFDLFSINTFSIPQILISDTLLSYHHLLSFELICSGTPTHTVLLRPRISALLSPSHCPIPWRALSSPHPVWIPWSVFLIISLHIDLPPWPSLPCTDLTKPKPRLHCNSAY